MASLLEYACVTEEDLKPLQPDIREKLDIAFENLVHEASESKSKLNSVSSEYENNTNVLIVKLEENEKEYVNLKEKFDELSVQLEETKSKYRAFVSENSESLEKIVDLQRINSELSSSLRNSENEKEILCEQLKHKMSSVNELTEELDALKSEAESVRKLKLETLCRLEDIESRENAQKVQDSRHTDELSSLQRHVDWLEERLRQLTSQILTVRRDTSHKVNSLESELELRKTELENTKSNLENVQESAAKLAKANENYIEKLKHAADEQIKIEQLYSNELDAQKQLVNLYKDQLNDAESKNNELTEAAASMQAMLKSAYENINRLECDKLSTRQRYDDELHLLEDKLRDTTEELDRHRQLLEKFRIDGLSEDELRQINPAVAATLSALKRGHSLTQLYAEYIQVVEDRDQLRLDKQRLTEYVKELVDEVKEKAPMLREQQGTYKKTKLQLQDMTTELQATKDKLKDVETRRQELQRRAGYFQRETGRWKQTCADLSKQVQILLRELEVNRGVVIEPPIEDSANSSRLDESPLVQPLPDSSTLSSSDLKNFLESVSSSASAVIDEHLVTWRSLQELQSQNQRLLCVSRDLADQLEAKEATETETSKRISELSIRLETVMGELEVVRMSAREARAEIDVLTRQRNAYRSLLEQHDIQVLEESNLSSSVETDLDVCGSNEIAVLNKSSSKSQPGPIAAATIEKLEETLSSLETEFKRYREDKTESDKIYTSTIDQLRKETSEARLLNQKLAAQLDFTHEKLRIMETNVSGYKQEITVLREMNARYSTSAASSEAELSRLRDELLRTSDRLLEVEVDARHSAKQLELSRANEARWRQEVEAIKQQEQMHTRLLHQLEAIQGNLEQRESTDRKSAEKRVAQLEKELSETQSAFTEANSALKSRITTLEHELTVSKESLASRDVEITKLNSEIAKLENDVKALPPSFSIGDDEHMSETDRLREALVRQAELQSEINGLSARLETSRRHADKMKELAEEAETRLKSLDEENKNVVDRLNTQLNETKQRCDFLESQLDLEKDERQNLVSENIRITEEAHQLNADLHRDLSALQTELDSVKQRCESALELEAGAKATIETYEQQTRETREKYERELAMHAEDVEALVEARRQLSELQVKLDSLQKQLTDAENVAKTVSKDMSAANALWDEEKEQLKKNLAESEKEHSMMQEQVLKLTQQIVALRKLTDKSDGISKASSSGTTPDESPVDDLKTSEDLLQLVSYLRRQKSIAEASYDASSAEVSRLLLRVANLENQVSSLTEELSEERKSNELSLETAQRHSQLMERVEQLNLITESNRLLRRERETLQSTLETSEKQMKDLENLVGPLRERNNELVGELESLTSERRSLLEERDRWKERCNRLVETAQRMDPEQYRMACNERDDLQRKLRRTEEENAQQVAKLNKVQGELEQRLESLDADLKQAIAAKEEAEKQYEEQKIGYENTRRTLESSEMTLAKLRALARKLRQDKDSLQQQLSATAADEAQLTSLNESLTEARADLVTTKSDLVACRTEISQLSNCIEESLHMIESYKSHGYIGPLLCNISEAGESSDVHRLVNRLKAILEAVSLELTKQAKQAEEQRERLLRTQLIESQLTKSQKECSELRARLNELQTAPVSAVLPTSSSLDFEQSEPTASHSVRPALFTSIQTVSEVAVSSESCTSQQIQYTDAPVASISCQPISAWMVRAAAAVQPVQPTPSLTPPNSTKQTAEIRPITSNVATVMPTPASQIVQTTVIAPTSEVSTTSTSATTAYLPFESSSPMVASTVAEAHDTFACRPDTTTVLRSATRRTTVMSQPQLMEHPFPVICSAQLAFPRSPSVPSVASVTGKRRHEELSAAGSSTSNSDLTDSVHTEPHSDTLSQPISESKRSRQVPHDSGDQYSVEPSTCPTPVVVSTELAETAVSASSANLGTFTMAHDVSDTEQTPSASVSNVEDVLPESGGFEISHPTEPTETDSVVVDINISTADSAYDRGIPEEISQSEPAVEGVDGTDATDTSHEHQPVSNLAVNDEQNEMQENDTETIQYVHEYAEFTAPLWENDEEAVELDHGPEEQEEEEEEEEDAKSSGSNRSSWEEYGAEGSVESNEVIMLSSESDDEDKADNMPNEAVENASNDFSEDVDTSNVIAIEEEQSTSLDSAAEESQAQQTEEGRPPLATFDSSSDTTTTTGLSTFSGSAIFSKPSRGLFGSVPLTSSGGLFSNLGATSTCGGSTAPTHVTTGLFGTTAFNATVTSSDESASSLQSTAAKPKIQPIVWDNSTGQSASATQAPSHPTIARRAKWGGTSHGRLGPYSTRSATSGHPPTSEPFGSGRGDKLGSGVMRPGPRRK